MTTEELYSSPWYHRLTNLGGGLQIGTVRGWLGVGPGARVLEVGAGRGLLARGMERLGWDITAVESNPHAVDTRVTDAVRLMAAESLEFPDSGFDALVSAHTIEHIPDLDRALGEMTRVVRPGGRLLFIYPAEPVRGSWALWSAVTVHHDPRRARDIHCHRLWPSKLERLAAPWGLSPLRHGFKLTPLSEFVSMFRRVPG